MDGVLETGQAGGWTRQQYRSELGTMLSQMRQDLKAGHVALNVRHRPWATT